MEPGIGIEPTTYSLRVSCSTPELSRRDRSVSYHSQLDMVNDFKALDQPITLV